MSSQSTAVPDEERIVVIEDSSELRLNQPHTLYLESQQKDAYGHGGLTIRQLFVASIVTGATLLANRDVLVVPGTSVHTTDTFALGMFDLAWTTFTVLWFAQIMPKHLGAMNPDRYLKRLLRWLFPLVAGSTSRQI